jgi:hypothetical protein
VNPPSDVIVLSVKEPILSLPLLLDALEVSRSTFFCGRGGSTGRTGGDVFVETGREVLVDTGGDALFKVEGCVAERVRRRSRVPELCTSATAFDTEGDVVDGGGLAPELRRGVMGPSRSRCFLLGDELEDPEGFSASARFSRRR